MIPSTKRAAFHVTVRRITTGTDYSAIRFLKTEADAFDVMARLVWIVDHIERKYLRLVSCRPATESEIAAHKARLAAC